VIFLETEYQEMFKRNNNRKRYVSEKVINDMLEKLDIVEDFEAEIVEWLCI
jgi:predicted kinase